jgi:hypothetical protein
VSLNFMEPPGLVLTTTTSNWSFGGKGYVCVEVIHRRANNIKLSNEMMNLMMVKSFERSVTTRNMVCHNVDSGRSLNSTSQTEPT